MSSVEDLAEIMEALEDLTEDIARDLKARGDAVQGLKIELDDVLMSSKSGRDVEASLDTATGEVHNAVESLVVVMQLAADFHTRLRD